MILRPCVAASSRAVLRCADMSRLLRAQPRRRLPSAASLPAIAIALVALAGCAGAPRRPPVPVVPPPVRPAPGYDRMADSLSTVDAGGLAGRRIAIDPGHGGFFPGAIGVHGLTEAEVNLGVALRLRDQLAAHGAEVLLTRTENRDFLTPADSSLRSDLAARARMSNAFAPDLFLSIHHNADAGGLHDVNETQTYYKLGDEGPSLDVAQDVHRALVRNVGIEKNKVVPGNFFVVRSSDAPALLTETSYLTNPDVEERLRLPEKQQLEADALFVGLARYFARPVPVVESFAAVNPVTGRADTTFDAADPMITARIRGAFDRARLWVDGTPVSVVRSDSLLTWRPATPWTGGIHEAVLRVGLGGTGSARERRVWFHVLRPVRRIEVEPARGVLDRTAGSLAAFRVVLREANGEVHVDTSGTGPERIRLRRGSGRGVSPVDTTVFARDGVAWVYFQRRAGRTTVPARYRVSLVSPTGRSTGAPSVTLTLTPGRVRGWTGFVLQMPDSASLHDASGTGEPAPRLRWLNRDGFAAVDRDSVSGRLAVPSLAGYRLWDADTLVPPRFTALLGGALHGRRITLDPEGGGDDAAGQGSGGTRASNLNLECARIVAGFLTAAGAEVLMTREGDVAVSEAERVQASEAFHADRYLRIGHRSNRLGYYFSSAAGKRWAEHTATEFERLGLLAPRIAEDPAYPLTQTSCPALVAAPAAIDQPEMEVRLLAPGGLRSEAYAMFLGLAREWAPDAAWAADSIEVRDAAGAPLAGVAVTLGGALVVETDAFGRARFARTEPGPIEAGIEDPRARGRVVLLELQRGAVVTGSRDR
jgi:N-acetylmuramoyl-L-alanine amidase